MRSRLAVLPAILVALSGCAVLRSYPAGPKPDFARLERVAWKAKNIIIVLGMRTERWGDLVVVPLVATPRILETARLYRDCKASGKRCLILASGGDPASNGMSEAAVMKRELVGIGIPSADVLVEERSGTTHENAENSRPILQKEAPDLTVLVTSGPHLKRALRLFEEFQLHPIPAPADPG